MESPKINNIVIGTTNRAKFEMYRDLLDFLEERSIKISMLNKDQMQFVKINERIDSLQANAICKAKIYAKITNALTLSDDTGFFIPALNNEPGIAVRRWGGKLSSNIGDKEWEAYFLEKIRKTNIQEPVCYKHHIIAISDPNGNYQLIENQINGKIKTPGSKNYIPGGPLSKYFFISECQRFESDLTKEDKKILFGKLRLNILEAIIKFGEV